MLDVIAVFTDPDNVRKYHNTIPDCFIHDNYKREMLDAIFTRALKMLNAQSPHIRAHKGIVIVDYVKLPKHFNEYINNERCYPNIKILNMFEKPVNSMDDLIRELLDLESPDFADQCA